MTDVGPHTKIVKIWGLENMPFVLFFIVLLGSPKGTTGEPRDAFPEERCQAPRPDDAVRNAVTH